MKPTNKLKGLRNMEIVWNYTDISKLQLSSKGPTYKPTNSKFHITDFAHKTSNWNYFAKNTHITYRLATMLSLTPVLFHAFIGYLHPTMQQDVPLRGKSAATRPACQTRATCCPTGIQDPLCLWCLVEGSLEVKLPTIWTVGKAEVGRVREEKRRREIREEKEWEGRRCRCAKGRKVAIHCVFSNDSSLRRVQK